MLLARTGTFASKVAPPVVTVTGDIAMSPMAVAGVIEDVLPVEITGDIAMSPMTVAGVLSEKDTYRRPGGADTYRRPGGVDLYVRPD